MDRERPKLREELRFSIRSGRSDGDFQVLIEDPLGGGFLETDRETATFVHLLDGRRTTADALRRLRLEFPGSKLSAEEVPFLIEELRLQGLLAGDPGGPGTAAGQNRIGLIVQKIRLGTFDGFFRMSAHRLSFVYSPWGFLFLLALLGYAGSELVAYRTEFAADLRAFLSVDAILWLWLAWVTSKVWHETQHGIVARLYNVEVREVGILMVLFLPLGAYVDVSGGWRLDSRWKRLHITLAGMAGEFVLAAAALLLWVHAPEGNWRQFLQAIVIATTISTVVFNANPLMRFDGYYAVVDLFDIPNLYQRGMAVTRACAIRLLTGTRTSTREPVAIALYGWLSLAWRLSVACTLTLLAARMAFGFGVVLALAVIWNMIIKPATRLLSALWTKGPATRKTLSLRLVTFAALTAGLWFLPVPSRIAVPALIDFQDSRQIRAASAGQVAAVLVDNGDAVKAGEVIVRLVNNQMAAEHLQLETRYAALEIEVAEARWQSNPSLLEDARGRLRALGEELAESRHRIDGQLVAAPRDGIVISEDLPSRVSTWLSRGELIGEVADPGKREIRAWLLPDDAERLRDNPIDLRFFPEIAGVMPGRVRLERIAPSASTTPPPDAVTAAGGGPLTLRIDEPDRRLVEARFEATFVPGSGAPQWQAGAPGTLVSAVAWVRLGDRLRHWFGQVNFEGLLRPETR